MILYLGTGVKRTESRKGSSPLLGLRVENKNNADTLLTTAHSSADTHWMTSSVFNELQFVST